jgi:hypothetical protein
MGGGSTTSSTTTKIPAEIRERGTKITNAAMGTYFDPATKYQAYTPSNPNFTQNQQTGAATTGQLNQYNSAGGAAGQNFANAGTGYQGYFNQAKTGLEQANNNNQATGVAGPNYSSDALQKFMNPYTQNVIDQGVTEIGRDLDSQMQSNSDAAAKAGAFGGARHGIIDSESQRNAAATLQNFIGSQLNTGFTNAQNQYNTDQSQQIAANTANNAAKQQNFNQQQSLSQLLANLGQQDSENQLAVGSANLNLGNVITAQDQAQKTNAYNYGYLDQRNYPMDIYQDLAGINAMQPTNRTSTTTESQSGGWLGPALGAAGAIMSDERMKEEIEEVNPEEVLGAFAKVTPKSYVYKDDARKAYPELTAPGRRTGFMAQDLEGAFGKPSGHDLDGIKTVDVGEMIGRLTAAVHGLEKRTHHLRKAA